VTDSSAPAGIDRRGGWISGTVAYSQPILSGGMGRMNNIPIRVRRESRDGAIQIQRILRVARSVAGRQHGIGLADVEVILRDHQARGGEFLGRFDDRGGEAAHHVELDVAVEQPYACMRSVFSCQHKRGWRRELIWIVGSEADHGIRLGLKHDGVALHGGARVVGICAGERPRVRQCSFEDLELVAVKMPWVQIAVLVVDDDFDNVVVFDDVRVDLAIYKRIRGVVATHGQSTV